ncbi:hypothetical protein D046_6527B, partial [Vibrio parahaemolyticus V-223/04]
SVIMSALTNYRVKINT